MATVNKSKHKSSVAANKQHLKTGLLFCLLTLVLNLLAYYASEKEYVFFFNIFTTKLASNLIQFTGLKVLVQENVMQLANAVWIVDTECTAINLFNIFIAFVVVYPTSLKAKGIALLFGLPFLFIANIFRLLGMAWVDKLKPEYSTFFHDYLWQVVFLVMIAFMWLIWIDKVVNRAPKTTVPA